MKKQAIVLAGGKSSRMGRDKALLKLGEKTVIEHVINELGSYFENVVISTNTPNAYRFLEKEMIPDIYPNKGPLSGIHAGLAASTCEVNFVTACDMPLISVENASRLLSKFMEGYDVVFPKVDGKLQPLFGVYRKGIASVLEDLITSDQLKITALLDYANVYIMKEEEFNKTRIKDSFINVNLPSDYVEVQQLFNDREGDK